MGGAQFLEAGPTECRNFSRRCSALLELELVELGGSAIPLFGLECWPRVCEEFQTSSLLDLFSQSLPLLRSAPPRSAKRIESEAKRSVTSCALFRAASIFNSSSAALPWVAADLRAAISDRGCPNPGRLVALCGLPHSIAKPSGAIFLPAALGSIGYLSRARDSRARVLSASSLSGCCSGDSCSAADSGVAGSRPPQGRGVAAGGASSCSPRESASSQGWGPGREDGGPKPGDSRATGRRSSRPRPSPIVLHGRASFLGIPSGSAASRRQVRAEPCGGLRGAAWRRFGGSGRLSGALRPRSRVLRVLRALGAVSFSAAPKRKAPFGGASRVRLTPLPCSGLRHLGPFGPSSSIRGASNGFGIASCCD